MRRALCDGMYGSCYSVSTGRLVPVLLNNLYDIQARGGCACAGSHAMVCMDRAAVCPRVDLSQCY